MSGHMRSHDICKQNIQDRIIEPLKKYNFNVDLLLSTWDNYGYRSDDFISEDFINNFTDAKESFYRSLTNFPTFGKGWLNRVAEGKKAAEGMLG